MRFDGVLFPHLLRAHLCLQICVVLFMEPLGIEKNSFDIKSKDKYLPLLSEECPLIVWHNTKKFFFRSNDKFKFPTTPFCPS